MKVCVYVVNENPFYMTMVSNSIKMLRDYNKSIAVRVFFVKDNSSQTIHRKNQIDVSMKSEDFIDFCKNYNVEVIERPPFGDCFYLCRKYISECEEDSILHIDGDTFVFDDVEKIFSDYQDFDFAACRSLWFDSKGFSSNGLGIKPFNSGVMLFNNGLAKKWASQIVDLCEEIKNADGKMREWIKQSGAVAWNYEEIALNVFVAKNRLKTAYLPEEYCYLVINEDSWKKIVKSRRTIILHTYTDHWVDTYIKLRQKKSRTIFFGK